MTDIVVDKHDGLIEELRSFVSESGQFQLIEGNLDEIFSDLSRSGKQSIVFCSGGDGSLNHQVNAIMKHELSDKIKVAYYPGGTGNDFARGVGLIDLSSTQFFKLLENDKIRKVQLAQIDHHYFVNMASCGEFAKVSPNADEDLKGVLGRWSYFFEGLSRLQNIEASTYDIESEDEKWLNKKLFGFFVGNSRYCGGGALVTPQADVEEEFLDILLVEDQSIADLVALGLKLQMTDVDGDLPGMIYRKVKSLKVKSKSEIPMSLDGEVYQTCLAQFKMAGEVVEFYLPDRPGI